MCDIKKCETCGYCNFEKFYVPNDPKCEQHYTAYCKYKGIFLAINFRKTEPLPLPKNCPIASFNLK